MQARRILPTLLLAAGVHPVSTVAQQPDMGRRSTVYAPRAAAATSQPLATAAALEIMQQGGNAVDAAERVEPGRAVTDSETIYLTVADADGNMVSFINSVYSSFGSGIVVPGLGFALQNRGAGFTMAEGHPNRVGPRKRPFHTIIPGFVTRDGEPVMAFGVMGGSMQPQGHTQLLLNMLVFGMDPQEAVDAARFRHLSGRRVAIEGVGDEVAAELEARGHELADWRRTDFGGAQVILRLARGWAAASEPRKDGHAAGH